MYWDAAPLLEGEDEPAAGDRAAGLAASSSPARFLLLLALLLASGFSTLALVDRRELRSLTSAAVATLALLPSGFLFTRVYLSEWCLARSAWACLKTSSTLSTFRSHRPKTCFLFCLALSSIPRVEASPCHSSGKRKRLSCSASKKGRRSSPPTKQAGAGEEGDCCWCPPWDESSASLDEDLSLRHCCRVLASSESLLVADIVW